MAAKRKRLRRCIRRCAERGKAMNLINDEFTNTVAALIAEVSPNNCDAEEFRLAQALQALPICFDLWSYVLLTPQGEVVFSGLDLDEERRSASLQDVLLMLRIGAERYPRLERLLPSRSAEATICRMCSGSGVFQTGDTPPQRKRCLNCVGWGWTL